MKKQLLLIIGLTVLVTSACRNNQYVTSSYEKRKTQHEVIAILPLQSIYTGKIPEEVTDEEIQMIEDAQSLRFQDLAHSALIYNSGIRRDQIAVSFMSPTVINAKLESMGLSVRDAAIMDPVALADSLGVDAIIRGRVAMNRFISDLESLKIDAAETAIRTVAAAVGVPIGLPGATNFKRTYSIESGLELLDAKDGVVLWKINTARNADWSYQPEQAISSMAYQFANVFPYRNREFK